MEGRGRQRLPCKVLKVSWVLTEVKLTNIARITEGWSLTSPDTQISHDISLFPGVEVLVCQNSPTEGMESLGPWRSSLWRWLASSRGRCSTREWLLYRAPVSVKVYVLIKESNLKWSFLIHRGHRHEMVLMILMLLLLLEMEHDGTILLWEQLRTMKKAPI